MHFVYFGTKFIREEAAIPSYHYRGFISASLAKRYLSQETVRFMEVDLEQFEESFKIKRTGRTGFVETINKIYVYEAGIHAPMRSVRPDQLIAWGVKFEEQPNRYIDGCSKAEHGFHDHLLPYLYDNEELLTKYEVIDREGGTRKENIRIRYDMLKSIKRGSRNHLHTCFHCVGKPFTAGFYTENEWTEQLFYSIEDYLPNGVSADLTYDFALQFKKLQQQYSDCGIPGCYLFVGAPDIILTVDETNNALCLERFDNCDVIELKVETLTSSNDSISPDVLPNEVGQVAANLYFLCVARSLKKIMAGTLPSHVAAKGLLMTRHNTIMMFWLKQSIGGLTDATSVTIKYAYIKSVDVSRLAIICKCFEVLIS